MQTHLLKLDPPYNIICGRNNIAKHVATLIVANIKYDEKYRRHEVGGKEIFFGGPFMRTYSFPIVEYGDGSAAGDVWDSVEVRECRVIAKAPQDGSCDDTLITRHWFCETLRFLHQDEYGSTQTPGTLYEQLKSLHVDVDPLGAKQVEVELEFNDYGDISSIDSAAGSELFFTHCYATENEKQKKEMFDETVKWAIQYVLIFNVQTVFTTKAKQYQELLAAWNEDIERVAEKRK